MAYLTENRATIRSHIGRLMFGNKFLTDVIASVGVNYVATLKARRFGLNHFTGGTMHVVTGAVAGAATYVSSSEPGSGNLFMNPVLTVMPAIADKIEVWPDDYNQDDINDAIDLAIMDVQTLGRTYVTAVPAINADGLSVTIPASWVKVARLVYEHGGYTRRLRPTVPSDRGLQDDVFFVENGKIVVRGGIPASATNIRIAGYTGLALPTNDTDPIAVRSDFIVYKAAAISIAHQMQGQLLDPEMSNNKFTVWTQQAQEVKRSLNSQYLSNTVLLEEV